MIEIFLVTLSYPSLCLDLSITISWELLIQVQFFFSCLTRKGNTPVGSGGAVTPPPPPVRACLVLRSEWATIGLTIPCWPKPGELAFWGTRNWLTACYGISQTFVPTRIIDWWPSGKVVWRKWMPVPLEKREWRKGNGYFQRKPRQFAFASKANVLLLSFLLSIQRKIKKQPHHKTLKCMSHMFSECLHMNLQCFWAVFNGFELFMTGSFCWLLLLNPHLKNVTDQSYISNCCYPPYYQMSFFTFLIQIYGRLVFGWFSMDILQKYCQMFLKGGNYKNRSISSH